MKKCKNCLYRGKLFIPKYGETACCLYTYYTGNIRNSDINNCEEYKIYSIEERKFLRNKILNSFYS